MNTMLETDLMRQAKFVKRIRIEETPDKRYRTHITIQKEEHEQLLITQRKIPKEWASLDRLIKHISSIYEGLPVGSIPNISITLSHGHRSST
jgi:hypothetical protein